MTHKERGLRRRIKNRKSQAENCAQHVLKAPSQKGREIGYEVMLMKMSEINSLLTIQRHITK